MNYLDSSALVKLVVQEPESEALARFLGEANLDHASSALAKVEVIRSVRRHGNEVVADARLLLQTALLLPVTDVVLDLAANVDPSLLRSLDAIHLASAQLLGEALTAFVTYDARLAAAATAAGFVAVSPE
ncbi:MAG TPA: type II toxin-antitoxin system VapC family toxin [Tepidiformaceae bacterium]|nr:type II toxin-antitoxin system VapC family toxin [Tepidiformaceae bacterium]